MAGDFRKVEELTSSMEDVDLEPWSREVLKNYEVVFSMRNCRETRCAFVVIKLKIDDKDYFVLRHDKQCE